MNWIADATSYNDLGFKYPARIYPTLSALATTTMAGYNAMRRKRKYRKVFRSSFMKGRGASARKRFRGSGGRSTSNGNGVTAQHDRRQVYRKKRMNRGVRRGWRKFKNKVHAISEKELGSRTVVFNRTVDWTVGAGYYNQTSGNHLFLSFSLYGAQATNSWFNDLNNISGYENVSNPTASAGGYVDSTTKFIFQSAVLDLTITNTSATILTQGTPPTFNTYGGKMEIDIYEVTVGQGQSDLTFSPSLTTDYFTNGANETLNIGGAGDGIQFIKRGVTPWDLPQALSRHRIKIWKKTKFFIDSLGTLTYQMRDPKRHVISKAKMANLAGCNYPGWTRHIIIVGKLVPGYNVGNGVGSYVEKLDVGVTRKYLYKLEGQNDTRDRYLTGL